MQISKQKLDNRFVQQTRIQSSATKTIHAYTSIGYITLNLSQKLFNPISRTFSPTFRLQTNTVLANVPLFRLKACQKWQKQCHKIVNTELLTF